MLRHVVIWSMAAGHEGNLDSLLSDLSRLPEQIDEIVALSAGRLLNTSNHDGVLCVDLEDTAALERYRQHPAHQPVLTRMREEASEIVAADYEI